jgi:L-fuconolactonase
MRIDSHQHFWRYDPAQYGWIDDSMTRLRRDFLPADLEPLLDAAGFDACVAVQARQTLEETRWLLELAADHSFIAGVVGWVDLQSAAVERDLEALSERKTLVGIRHIVQAEPDDFLLRPAFRRGVGLLERFGLAYDILIYPRHLKAAEQFVSSLPSQRFVLDHVAKPEIRSGRIDEWRGGLAALAHCPNVVCKLSGLMTEADWQSWTPDQIRPYLDAAFECFGADRLMIGSDWPVCTLAAPYERTVAVIDDYVARCSEAERGAVLGGTAARFWNLTLPAGRPPAGRDVGRGL